MSGFDKTMHNVEDLEGDGGRQSGRPKQPERGGGPPQRIVVDKRTHRVRLENETESEVTVVIEEKGGKG